jgi:preprotein translocase subunit SecY
MPPQPTGQDRFAGLQAFGLSDQAAKRIRFTLGALIVWRLGNFLPLPGINLEVFAQLLAPPPGALGSFIVSDAVARVSVFSLGVTPYVASFILLHLLCAFSAHLRDLRRAGASGWRRFNQLIRAVAVFFAVVQGYGIAVGLEGVRDLVPQPGFLFRTGVVVSLVAGTMFLIWLGDQISARGVGDGVWLIFAAGYIAGVPAVAVGMLGVAGSLPAWVIPACLVLLAGMTALVVLVERAERRLPLRYRASAGVERAPFLSLKIDNTGVLAPMLAAALIILPALLATQLEPEGLGWATNIARTFARGHPLFFLVYAGLIVFLVFFFTAVAVDSRQLARELGVRGGTVVGIEEGERTVEHIDNVLAHLTLIGAVYLVILCLVPEVMIAYAAFPLYLGGVALLVTVLVALGILADVAKSIPAPPNAR